MTVPGPKSNARLQEFAVFLTSLSDEQFYAFLDEVRTRPLTDDEIKRAEKEKK